MPASERAEECAGRASRTLRVYCDLDGVLADFSRGCLELFPEGGPIAAKMPTHTVTKLTREEEGEMWRRVESKADFFLSLEWMPDGEELWRWIDWNVVPSPAILTGLPMGRAGQMASKQKEQWCHQRLGDHVAVFCCGTRNKQKFSGQNCVLIDDRGDLREAWEARGGIFIHHTSARESIRQIREVIRIFHEQQKIAESDGCDTRTVARPLCLTSVCWAAQTPAGCFRANCRYLHVPISRRHRNWIQLWGFVWWNQRMFDDIEELTACVRSVYSPGYAAAFNPQSDDMDEQSQGAFKRMYETLWECCELGMPFEFIQAAGPRPSLSPVPPLARQAKAVLASVGSAVRASEALGLKCHLAVVGSMGLGVDVDGSDLDLVLCAPVEMEPLATLQALQVAVVSAGEATNILLVAQAATPVLSFRLHGMSIDVVVNQMGSVRDTLLFRYALRSSGPELAATLRLLKLWLKQRQIPSTKQGGFPALVWVRMAVRFYQEQSSQSGRRVAKDWLRRFLIWTGQGLPTGGAPLTIHGEQAESGSDRLAAGLSAATLLMLMCEVYSILEIPPTSCDVASSDFPATAAHLHLCRIGRWDDALALFYMQVGGSRPEVVLCRVQVVFGGPQTDIRYCTCKICTALGACPTEFVSRRSQDWLIFATRVDPQRFRVQVALQGVGVQKKRPVEDQEDQEILVFHPRQLISQLALDTDPIKELARAQRIADELQWLPSVEPQGLRLGRNLLIAARQHVVSDKQLQWFALPQSDVYERAPQQRVLEKARARTEALARLRNAKSLRALRRAICEESEHAAGSEELQDAEARLAFLIQDFVPATVDLREEDSSGDESTSEGHQSEASRITAQVVGLPQPQCGGGLSATDSDCGGTGLVGSISDELTQHILMELHGDHESSNADAKAKTGNDEDDKTEETVSTNSGSGVFSNMGRNAVGRVKIGQLAAGAVDEACVPAASSDSGRDAASTGGEGEEEDSQELANVEVLCLKRDTYEEIIARPDAIEVHLQKAAPGDILGFSCEVDAVEPAALRVVSISERGMLGRRNRGALADERVGEGSWILAVNGVAGDTEKLRSELEREGPLVLIAVPDHRSIRGSRAFGAFAASADSSGRRLPGIQGEGPLVSTGDSEGSHLPRCRCGKHCKCGLADALGRERDDPRRRLAWPALCAQNLRPDVDEETLYAFFSEKVAVATVKIVRDAKTWQSECHGFINFRTFHDAEQALDTLHGRPLLGRRVHLSWSSKAQRTPQTRQEPTVEEDAAAMSSMQTSGDQGASVGQILASSSAAAAVQNPEQTQGSTFANSTAEPWSSWRQPHGGPDSGPSQSYRRGGGRGRGGDGRRPAEDWWWSTAWGSTWSRNSRWSCQQWLGRR